MVRPITSSKVMLLADRRVAHISQALPRCGATGSPGCGSMADPQGPSFDSGTLSAFTTDAPEPAGALGTVVVATLDAPAVMQAND